MNDENISKPKYGKANRKRLSLKEQAFVDEYIKNGGNASGAALKVYDTAKPAHAATIGKDVLDREIVRVELERRLHELKGDALQTMGNALSLAIQRAKEDLLSDDPQTVHRASKYLLDCSKFLDSKQPVEKTENLGKKLYPSRQ